MAGSWLSQFLHALADGAIGKSAPTHTDDATNPLHAAVDSVSQAADNVGATATSIAQSEVTGIVTKYAGGPTGTLAALLLQAVIDEANIQLQKAKAPTDSGVVP